MATFVLQPCYKLRNVFVNMNQTRQQALHLTPQLNLIKPRWGEVTTHIQVKLQNLKRNKNVTTKLKLQNTFPPTQIL